MTSAPAVAIPDVDRRPAAASWLAAHWPALAVGLLIAAYIAFFGTLTVRQHDAFETTAFDLGNVDQAVWNTRHGRFFAMTNIEGLENRLGTHVEPILLPVSLLYFAWSDPRALLLLQTVVIALGAWAVYKLANLQICKSANEQPGTCKRHRFTHLPICLFADSLGGICGGVPALSGIAVGQCV